MEFIKPRHYVSNTVCWVFNTDTTASDDLVSFGFGAVGNLVPNAGTQPANFKKRVQLPDTSSAATNWYLQLSQPASTDMWNMASEVFPRIKLGTSEYGVWWAKNDATTIDIFFGKDGATPGTTWANAFTAGHSWRLERQDGYQGAWLSASSTASLVILQNSVWSSTPVNLSGTNNSVNFINSATPTIVNLPSISGSVGYTYWIKNVNTGLVTITPNGAETIEGVPSLMLDFRESVTIMASSIGWHIV